MSDSPRIARTPRASGSVHAVLDPESRRLKARKILRLLDLQAGAPRTALEIGCGSAAIAAWLGTQTEVPLRMHAVDVVDNRVVFEGYDFQQVADTRLPFADRSIDVVISNHVIEHVGGEPEQLAHLREAARVLAPGGIGYLAVPNRWQLVEPHYRLPFLSWLPRALRTPYLRALRRGDRYDCEPLTQGRLEQLLAGAGLRGRNVALRAMRETLALEPGSWRWSRALLGRVPDAWLRPLLRLCPTHVYLFARADDRMAPAAVVPAIIAAGIDGRVR